MKRKARNAADREKGGNDYEEQPFPPCQIKQEGQQGEDKKRYARFTEAIGELTEPGHSVIIAQARFPDGCLSARGYLLCDGLAREDQPQR